ncbi:glucosyltransferase domain-containing protein [Mariniflexile soesokkakense]|uniref:Glucosyltransferase domain-containing protein n=1 Tax=Mariniflexile soesokkakense TaxID=1343160 RepID=A0ABV0A7N0_9FLAO
MLKLVSKFIANIKLIIKTKPILAYSIGSLIGCLLLNLGIFKEYAFLDANEYIWTAYKNPKFQNEFIQGGRFLFGIISEFVYGSLCNTIADLKWVRLFALLSCVFFSIQVFTYLLKLTKKVNESALFSFLILTLPSFSTYYSWSCTLEIPVLLCLNFFAGTLLIKAFYSKKHRILYYFVSLLIVVISLCIYQSAITAFLIPIVFSSLINRDFSIKKLISILIFIAISFSIYFIVFKTSLFLYGLEPTNRTKLDLLKLPLKVILFYLRELRLVFKGSGFLVAPIFFLIIGASSFLGFLYLLYQKRSKIPQFYFKVSCLILVLPLSYLPNLLSSQTFVCSRTIAPTAVIVLFYQFCFFYSLSLCKSIFKKLSLTLVLILIICSSINLNYYITRVQNKEHLAIKKAYTNIPLNNTKKIIIIKPKPNFLQDYGFYKQESADEFGHLSSVKPWAPEPLFRQILKERLDSLGLEKEQFEINKIEVYELGEKYNTDNSIVINLIDVLKKEFTKR